MKGENKGLKTAGLVGWIKIAGLDHSPCILLLESSTSSKIESIERFKLILCSEGLTELAPIQRLSAFDVEGLLRRSGPLTQSMASLFVVARRQSGDHARRCIRNVIMRARCVVNTVAATSRSATL